MTRLNTVKNRLENAGFGLINVGKKHGLGISVPDFIGSYIHILFIRINIQKELRGIPYLCYRFEGMFASDQREECNSIEYEKERTGNLEEVTHHKVRSPCGLQFGKAVENIESIASFFFDKLMYCNGKCFESVREFHIHDL